MSNIEIQWHPGFVAAANLEFRENKKDLSIEKEHNLNTRPLEIDLLIIKKNKGAHIINEIGRIFRGHNILEYKSPGDSLDIDVFYKATAYACLYKSYGQTVDAIRADDVTISLFRDAKPDVLFSYFKEHGYTISTPYQGIYYIEGNALFPTQVVVTRELNPEAHTWLTALSEKLQQRDMERLARAAKSLAEKDDLEFADSVIAVSTKANKEIVTKMRGGETMFEALYEVLQPQIEERIQQDIEKRVQERVEAEIAERIEAEIAKRAEATVAEKIEAEIAEKDAQIAMLTEQIKQLKQMANA